jgi:hypothetical protein
MRHQLHYTYLQLEKISPGWYLRIRFEALGKRLAATGSGLNVWLRCVWTRPIYTMPKMLHSIAMNQPIWANDYHT